MQTALHITSLIAEARPLLIGGEIVSSEFYKKERAAYLFVRNDKKRWALGMVFHPAGFGSFVVPASKVKLDTREKPWPIFGLDGAAVTDLRQVGLDRLFRLSVETKDGPRVCVFEAIGPNGNIWFVDDQDRRLATLRKRDFKEGDPYEFPPPPPDRLDPFGLQPQQLTDMLADDNQPSSLSLILEKRVTGFNRTLAHDALARADIEYVEDDEVGADDLQKLCVAVRQIADRFKHPETGYLYTHHGAVEVYPIKLKAADVQPEKFKSLSLAVQEMAERRQTIVEEIDEQKTVTAAVDRAVKRLARRVKNLQNDIDKAADYDHYRRLGELLQINHNRLQKGMEQIEVQDVYSDQQETVAIKLDPAKSAQENVEEYFRKYRKGKEGLEMLQRRLEITRDEHAEMKAIRAALEQNFDRAMEQYRAEIENVLPQQQQKQETKVRLPYREYELSSGLRIFVGRDGSDNDRTTFEFARPYELWFHTQQCPGSHVVMKFPNKKFEPSKREIEETAAAAAWHSKARSDSLVPVVYAERRYVRKPRGAKPGLVTVEREKSVMVAPFDPAKLSDK